MSHFRYRGVEVVVDTTEIAEHDIAGFQISAFDLNAIAENLLSETFSPRDRLVGALRVRELKGYDVIFTVGREERLVVITIGSIRPPDPLEKTEVTLKRLGVLAMLRGASGL